MRTEIEQDDPNKWFHSRMLEEVEVAIATGHLHDFWDLPENTQAYAIGRFRVRGVREAYGELLAKRDRKKPDKPASRPAGHGRRRR